MGNSSSCAHPRAPETDERSRKEAGGAAATPPGASGASGTSSFEKTVLLHDWWLIKVKDEHSRARLAVGGLVTTGKAARIFTSAPITKRYDGYTLETADGMTVRIQGLINASRMHHNGFPSEACNHFRIGFPYSWKDYADRYFRTDIEGNNFSTYASDSLDPSMESAKNPSYDSPICLKEFPVGRIVDCLNSICKEIVDRAQRGTGTKENLSENNHDNENMKGIVTEADRNIDVNSNTAVENAYITTPPENDYLGMSSLLDGLEKSNNNVSDDSSLCRNMNIISPLGKVAGLQMESLAVVVKNPDIEKQQIEPISTDTDGVMKDMNGNMCCGNALPAADFGANFFSNKLLPESGEASKSVAPRDHSIKEAEQVVCLSENTFLSHEPDVEVTEGIQSHMVFVNPPSSDAVCSTKRTRNSLKKGYAKSSSFSVLQSSAGKKHNQGASGGISHLDGAKISFTRIPREPLCTETGEIHLELSGAVKNDSRTAVKNILLRDRHYLYDELVGSVSPPTVTLKETSEKQLAIVDKGMHGETSLNYYMKDVRGKLSYYLKSAAKKSSLSVFEDVVNQPQENKELSCICLNTVDLGSEKVLVECSYNETNDLQSGSSVMGSSFGSVKGPSNICNNAEETITDSPNIGMTMSKPPNRWSSLRRSERLLKLKNSTEDEQIFLEHNKRINNKGGSKSISCGSQNGKGNIPNTKGASTTESHPQSAEMHAVVARKLNFSSHISLRDCDTTPIEDTLHIGLDKNNVSSKKQDVQAVHENLPKSQTRHGCQSHENSKDSGRENWSIADTGNNWVHLLSDNLDSMNSENVVKDSYDPTENRTEADTQNHDMATVEQSISDTGINGVAGHIKEVHESEVPLDRQQNDHKSSGRVARKSRQKTCFAPQMMKTPLTRQRTKELSLASPELLNFRRSRSGRLLVPPLANWCQQILYDMDGSVGGILTGIDAMNCSHRGTRSEPPRKKKKVV